MRVRGFQCPLAPIFTNKSVQAAVAAIEVYNKPNFSYREEAFALLMSNAWELLLKAKWLLDHGDSVDSLYELVDDRLGRKHQRPIAAGTRSRTVPDTSPQNSRKTRTLDLSRPVTTISSRWLRFVTTPLTS